MKKFHVAQQKIHMAVGENTGTYRSYNTIYIW